MRRLSPFSRWTRWRRSVQVGVVLLYVLLPFAHLLGLRSVTGNLASLRVGPVDLVEPAAGLGAVSAAWQVSGKLLLGMAPVVLLALALGPVLCSWVCPWGLVSELIDRGLRRHQRRPWTADGWRRWRWPRLLTLLTLLLASAALASPLLALISAPRLITQLPLEVVYLRVLSPVTAGLLLVLLAVELWAPRRLWCRVLCPVGSVAKLLRTPRTATVRFDDSTCLCPTIAQCRDRCPWGIDPRRMTSWDGCTNCFACVEVCPSTSLATGWGLK